MKKAKSQWILQKYKNLYIYIYTHTHTHTYIYIYIHTYIQTYIYTHTHIYIALEKTKRQKKEEEIDQLNRPITRNEVEYVIKNTPSNKSLGPDGFTGKFYQTYKEDSYPCSLNVSKRLKKEHSQRLL